MKRKLVKQGAATLMISLPAKWIKKYYLKKGDEVDIQEVENDLVISKEGIETKKKTKINLGNYTESSTRTAVVNAYRSGFDVIEINFKDKKHYNIIKDVLRDYIIGFDIIKKGENYCIIENITEPSEEQFDIIFRKILFSISSLIKNTEQRLRNEGFEDYKEMVMKIHKYDNFCRRVISKKNLFGSKSNLFWSFLTLLIHGQREIYHLNRFLDKNKVNFRGFEFFGKVEKIFGLLQEGYIKKDLVMLEEIHELEKKFIYDDFYTSIQRNQKESIILFHLAVSIKNFYLASSPLIGLLL